MTTCRPPHGKSDRRIHFPRVILVAETTTHTRRCDSLSLVGAVSGSIPYPFVPDLLYQPSDDIVNRR